jgi:hypothetical protein
MVMGAKMSVGECGGVRGSFYRPGEGGQATTDIGGASMSVDGFGS